jgi:hypothetical protein
MFGFKQKTKARYFIEFENGEILEQKHANHCLCINCCHDRELVNLSMRLKKYKTTRAVYFPEVNECPYGSDFLKRNKEHVEESKRQSENISKLCDSIMQSLKGIKSNDV